MGCHTITYDLLSNASGISIALHIAVGAHLRQRLPGARRTARLDMRRVHWQDSDIAIAFILALVLMFFSASYLVGRTLDHPEADTHPSPETSSHSETFRGSTL